MQEDEALWQGLSREVGERVKNCALETLQVSEDLREDYIKPKLRSGFPEHDMLPLAFARYKAGFSCLAILGSLWHSALEVSQSNQHSGFLHASSQVKHALETNLLQKMFLFPSKVKATVPNAQTSVRELLCMKTSDLLQCRFLAPSLTGASGNALLRLLYNWTKVVLNSSAALQKL